MPRSTPSRCRSGLSPLSLTSLAALVVLVQLVAIGPVRAEEGEHSGDSQEHSAGAAGPAYERPEYLAGAALVRVETSARVTVGVELGGEFRHTVEIPAGPETTRTGFYVNPGVVATTSSLVRDRLGVFAVNKVFADYLPQPLDDPFARNHAVDSAVDRTLQQCYRWRSIRSECVVKIQESVVVWPYANPPRRFEVDSRRADSQVLFLVLDCQGKPECSEVTLPVQPREAGEKYLVIAATGDDPLTPKVSGTLADDHENPVSASDARALDSELGVVAQGAPLLSTDGRVVGMAIRTEDGFGAVNAQHLVDDAEKQGVVLQAGSKTHHLYQGLTFLDNGETEQAANLLDDVAKSSQQTVIAGLAEEARQKVSATSPGVGAAQAAGAAGVSSGAPVWPWFLLGGVLLAALVAGAVVLARRLNRGGAVPAMAGAGAPGTSLEPPPPPRSAPPPRDSGATYVPAPRTGPPAEHPSPGAPVYCARCGTQLAPGDRYCFSCGAPSSVAGQP